MTEPVLSSAAGRKPPNPVLTVRSGNPELDPAPDHRTQSVMQAWIVQVDCKKK